MTCRYCDAPATPFHDERSHVPQIETYVVLGQGWPEHTRCSFAYTGNCEQPEDLVVQNCVVRTDPMGSLRVRCLAHRHDWPIEQPLDLPLERTATS